MHGDVCVKPCSIVLKKKLKYLSAVSNYYSKAKFATVLPYIVAHEPLGVMIKILISKVAYLLAHVPA